MNVRCWFNNENLHFEFLYVYAIYIQEPNSPSDVNVATGAMDCTVLCKSFPLFNKYWRTQIPFDFLRVCFFFRTLVINFGIFPHVLFQLFSEMFLHWQNRREHRRILHTLLMEANMVKDKPKRSGSILQNRFINEIKKASSVVIRWRRKNSTFSTCEWNLVTYVSFFPTYLFTLA